MLALSGKSCQLFGAFTITAWTQDGTRDAEHFPEKMQEIGEPDALKGASPVRGGADGKGLAGDTTCAANRQVYGNHSTSPAAYSTLSVSFALTGLMWSLE